MSVYFIVVELEKNSWNVWVNKLDVFKKNIFLKLKFWGLYGIYSVKIEICSFYKILFELVKRWKWWLNFVFCNLMKNMVFIGEKF